MPKSCDAYLPEGPPVESLRLGVSRCLLGEQVRYDGGHKWDRYLTDVLGPFVEFVPVCPEVECGLPIPREALRLVGDPEAPRLLTQKTERDFTEQMQQWGRERLEQLETDAICGYVFKTKSPSSGMSRVKVYSEDGKRVSQAGTGIWARMVQDRFPHMPFEDEGRLHDMGLRENFLTRVFVYKRLRDLLAANKTVGGLVDFHTRHKLLLMAHSPKHYTEMGRLVAAARELPLDDLFCKYATLLMTALELRATVKKNVNVLQHVAGYFKKQLDKDDKQELQELIKNYADRLVPLIVPVTLLNHYVRKFDEPYLKQQIYLRPHPVELMLRNHV